MSNIDPKEKRRAMALATALAILLLVLSFILGYTIRGLDKSVPIIIETSSNQ